MMVLAWLCRQQIGFLQNENISKLQLYLSLSLYFSDKKNKEFGGEFEEGGFLFRGSPFRQRAVPHDSSGDGDDDGKKQQQFINRIDRSSRMPFPRSKCPFHFNSNPPTLRALTQACRACIVTTLSIFINTYTHNNFCVILNCKYLLYGWL